MRVGIMQPYFLPYLGYFSLIHATDKWVVFDDVQFIRHGWIERNRVLNSQKELSYIKVPLNKHSRGVFIKDLTINNNLDWKKKIFDQLTSYKNKAPYYYETLELLKEVFNENFESISTLNIHLLRAVCKHVGIPFNYLVFSEMNLNLRDDVKHPGQWALQITKAIGGNVYINPVGGKDLFLESEFIQSNIKLLFCQNNLVRYEQNNLEFKAGLSIIDALMFNSRSEVLELIKKYKLLEK